MAYICYKPKGSCSTCPHCRWDDDKQRMCCWAKYDEENLTIFNANAFEVKIDNGRNAYIEMQEHCALLSVDNGKSFFPGNYYFPYEGATEFVFMVWENGNVAKELNCKIFRYSHDYGKTWTEVKY